MVLQVNDWVFDIDVEKTKEHSSFALKSHCICGYCVNYYTCVKDVYPDLEPFLERFFLEIEGPSEMYPIEPTLYLIGYKVYGSIKQVGNGPIMIDGLPIMGEKIDEETFKLEVGEIPMPWVLEEDMNEIISPANEPEFMERMYKRLIERNSGSFLFS